MALNARAGSLRLSDSFATFKRWREFGYRMWVLIGHRCRSPYVCELGTGL